LLHTETPDGSVIPVWEEARSENISALKDIMHARSSLGDEVELLYARIPITAERVPDFMDFSDLMDVVIRTNASNTPIVLNCQLGRGRSTLTAVCPMILYISSPDLFHF
jgi:protein-tyrosine phosphatase